MKILVVDDEDQIRRFLVASLTAHGFDVTEAATGKEAIQRFTTGSPDAMVLDLGLPDQDGIDVLKTIRGFSTAPVIVLSARHHEAQKITALDAGANDYVTKPFGVGELLARLRRLIRDLSDADATAADGIITVADLSINVPERSVVSSGKRIKLTKKEFEILLLLARHAGKVLTHSQILEDCWGDAYKDQTHYLRIYIKNLRQKLSDSGDEPKLIVTEPGVGYRLTAEADSAA